MLNGQICSWSLQWCLKKHWKAASDPAWWQVLPSQQCLEDLVWWMMLELLLWEVPFVKTPLEQTLFTDASLHIWGGVPSWRVSSLRGVDSSGEGVTH